MDKQTKKQPPENPSSMGSIEGPTKHKGSRTIGVTDRTPQEGTYGLTPTAGILQDKGHTTKPVRQLPQEPDSSLQSAGAIQTKLAAFTRHTNAFMPAMKESMTTRQPQGVKSLTEKKDLSTAMRMKLQRSDTDTTPDPDASDKVTSMDKETKKKPPENSLGGPVKTEHEGSGTIGVTDNPPQDGTTTAGIQDPGYTTRRKRILLEVTSMDKETRKKPPKKSPGGLMNTKHEGSGTIGVTDNPPQDGTTTAGIQDPGYTSRRKRILLEPDLSQPPADFMQFKEATTKDQMPAIKAPLEPRQPKGVESQKKDHAKSDRMNLRCGETDKSPDPVALEKGNNKTSTHDIHNTKATSDGTKSRAGKTVTGQISVSRPKSFFVKQLEDQFESSTIQQTKDVQRGTVANTYGRYHAITHSTEWQPLEQTDDEVTISKQGVIAKQRDEPHDKVGHHGDRRENQESDETYRQSSILTAGDKDRTPKHDKPEGTVVHTDDANKKPEAQNLERQPSGHTRTRENKVTNPKQDQSRQTVAKTEDRRYHEIGPCSKRQQLIHTKDDDVQYTASKHHTRALKKGPMEGDNRQPKDDGNLKVCKDETVERNQTQCPKDDWDLLLELGYRTLELNAKEEDQGMDDLSDKNYDQVSEDEEKDSQNSEAVSFEPHVSSLVPTNIQNEVSQLEEKPNTIIDQAKLKHIGKLWMLTVGKKSIQLPKDIKDARVNGKFLVVDNVIYEIHNSLGAIVLKPIEKTYIQTSHETDTADKQQTTSSKEQSIVSDLSKEKQIASNVPDRRSKENNLVKPKTRASAPSIVETLLSNVEMKDEKEDTADTDETSITFDDLMNGILNLSLQEKNDDVECSKNELSMSQTATKRTIEKQPVNASDQDTTVLKTSPCKSNVTQASFSVSARENATTKTITQKARDKSLSFDETAEVGENDMKRFEKSQSGERSDKKSPLQPDLNYSNKCKDTDQATSAAPAVPPRYKRGKQVPSCQYQLTPSNVQTVEYEGAFSGSNRGASCPTSIGKVIEKSLKCQISYNDNKEDISLEMDIETYMKLKYTLNNPNWLCQKQKNLIDQYHGMRIEYDRHMDIMIINLDVNKPAGFQSSIVDNTVKALLQKTDHLFVNNVPIMGIENTQVEEIINKHYLVKDRDLYVECVKDLEYLHYVCPHNVKTLVDAFVQITVKQLSGPKKSHKFNMVYKEIFAETSILEQIKSENRPVQVALSDINDDEFVCVLQGCSKDITWAENLIHTEIVEGHGFASFRIKDIKHSDEFDSLEISDLVEETLQNQFDSIVDHFNKNGTISICGPTQSEVDMCVANIKQMLKSKSILIENKDISLTQLKKYIEELQNTTYIHITLLGDNPYTVRFVGHKDSVELVETMLLEKINPQKYKAKLFKILDNEFELFNEGNKVGELTCENKQIWIKYTEVFTHICAKENLSQLAKMYDIQLEVKKTKTWQGFCVTGGIHQYDKLKEYINQYGCEDIALTFKNSEKLPEVIYEIERKHTVTLNVKDTPGPSFKENATGGSAKAIPIAEEVDERKVVITNWNFQGGHRLVVVHDDATNCWKDVLVDFNNAETRKSYSDGRVYEVGKGKRKTSVHIVRWDGGDRKEKHVLRQTFELMLKLTETYDCIDICIPITQVGNWPFGKYIKQMLYAIVQHLKNPDMLPVTIQLCTPDASLYRECCDAANNCLQSSVEPKMRQTKKPNISHEVKVKRQSLEVNVIKGQLDASKANILVNTTNHDLQLDTGAVSKALLKKAGNRLQQECSKNHRGKIKSGEIVVTKGYMLQCDHVFHSALDQYAGSALCIENVVMECLKRAGAMKCKTIAFPAIGTGNLSYPKHKVAAAMFDAVKRFEQTYNGSSVEQVDFVIYQGDQEAVRIFTEYQEKHDKQKGELGTTYDQNESTTIRLGKINVKARPGSLSNCTTDAIVYLWEKGEFHYARYGEHILLKEVGKNVQKDFDDHRNLNGAAKYKVFSTPGGKIPIPVIIHAPCEDNKDSITNSIRDSLFLLDQEKIKTASVWFPTQHPLLKLGDKLPKIIAAAVKEVQQFVVCLSDVCIVVEGKHNFQYFRSKGDFKTVTIKIIGKKEEIKSAIAALQHYIATGNLETMPDYDTSRKPTLPSTAPVGHTMQRDKEDISTARAAGRKPDILDTYVAIENIPSNYTLEKLGTALFAARIPILPPVLVYMDGSANGIAICISKEDANQLVRFKGIPGIRFKPQVKISIEPTCTIKCDQSNKSFIKEQLKKIHLTVQEKSDNQLAIIAPTSYQMHFAKYISSGASVSNRRYNNATEHIQTINVGSEVWEIAKNMKNKNYIFLEDNVNVTLCFKNETVIIEWSGVVSDDDEIRNNVEVLDAYCHSLQETQIEQIQLDTYNENETTRWCIEVEAKLGIPCCLNIPKQKKVFAYCDTYDDINKVKHEFLIKQGKMKHKRRRNRNIEVSEPPDVGHVDLCSAHAEEFGNHYEVNQTETYQQKVKRIGKLQERKEQKEQERLKIERRKREDVYKKPSDEAKQQTDQLLRQIDDDGPQMNVYTTKLKEIPMKGGRKGSRSNFDQHLTHVLDDKCRQGFVPGINRDVKHAKRSEVSGHVDMPVNMQDFVQPSVHLPKINPHDSESNQTVGIPLDHTPTTGNLDNNDTEVAEMYTGEYAKEDVVNASSQDDTIADSDILGSITTTNTVVDVASGSDMLGSIKAIKPYFGSANASEMLGSITTTKPIVQGATGSDMIGFITTKPIFKRVTGSEMLGSITKTQQNVQSTSDSSDEEEVKQLDTFRIIIRCKKRRGGYSTLMIKARNTEEALKWRYIFSNNQQHRVTKKLEQVCKLNHLRINSNDAEIECENIKPLAIEDRVKKIITQETIDLRVTDFRIETEECQRVVDVLTRNFPAFSDQTVSLFMECVRCYLVSPAHIFEASIESFQQTRDFFSTMLGSQATKRTN